QQQNIVEAVESALEIERQLASKSSS
ncbi:unnamed protein product, partial [Rotaria socialis]